MNVKFNRAVLIAHERLTGRRILACLEELNRSQWLSRDELLALQEAKLQRLVEYAYQYVPYYRRTFDEVGFYPEDMKHNPECFARLPILTKDIIRKNFSELQTTEPERRKTLSELATSGSTGQPLVFLQDSSFRDAVTADIQRHIGWAGWKLGDPQAFIWGASYKPSARKVLRTWLIDRAWNRFQMNAFALTEESMAHFAKKIQKEQARILFGYATSLHTFARFVRNSHYNHIRFDGAFTTSEMLHPAVRQFIEDTFQCRVFNRYGTLELGGVACECEAHTGLHVSVENNFVEILENGQAAKSGGVGDLIVTNLNNRGMPFIRYQIGDAAAWDDEASCPCGRAAPMLRSIEGRLVDTFKTFDGRSVWSGFAGATFRCLTHPTIRQFQVVQNRLDNMTVRLVPDGEVPQTVLQEITDAIKTTYGDCVGVDFELVEEIPALPSGKHQYAVSEVYRQ